MKHSDFHVRKCAISAFVNCFIHFSVLHSVVINADAELFDALVMVTYLDESEQKNVFGPARFSKAASALSIFVEMSTNGASLLNEAVKRSAQLRHVKPYSHLVDLLKNNSYASPAFRLLECAMRTAHKAPTINEMLNLLKACHIERALDAMETLKCVEQDPGFSFSIARFRMAFGDAQQMVLWFGSKSLDFESRTTTIISTTTTTTVVNSVNVENAKVAECRDIDENTNQLEEIKPYNRGLVTILHMEREKRVEVLAQKEIIHEVRGMWEFYQSFQGVINCYMSAWQCIDNGGNKSKTANVCGRDIQVDELVPLPGVDADATVAKNAIEWHRKGVAKKIMSNTSIKADDMDAISEACARGLALRYKDQINKLTVRDAHSLGTFCAMLVLESLRCDTFNVVEDSVSQKDIISVSVQVKEQSKSDKCIVPKSKKITITRSDEEHVWDQIGVFTKPGIKVNDVLYDGNHTDSSLYGYRVGSLSEVKDMGLTLTSSRQSCESTGSIDESIGTIESTGPITPKPVHEDSQDDTSNMEILEISPYRGNPSKPSQTVDTEGFKKLNKDIEELDKLNVKCDEENSLLF